MIHTIHHHCGAEYYDLVHLVFSGDFDQFLHLLSISMTVGLIA